MTLSIPVPHCFQCLFCRGTFLGDGCVVSILAVSQGEFPFSTHMDIILMLHLIHSPDSDWYPGSLDAKAPFNSWLNETKPKHTWAENRHATVAISFICWTSNRKLQSCTWRRRCWDCCKMAMDMLSLLQRRCSGMGILKIVGHREGREGKCRGPGLNMCLLTDARLGYFFSVSTPLQLVLGARCLHPCRFTIERGEEECGECKHDGKGAQLQRFS